MGNRPAPKTAFKKGQSGNPKGRPKGVQDKRTRQWAELVEYLESEGMGKLWDYLNGLEGEEFFEAYMKLIEYTRPKLARTELSGKVETEQTFKLSWGDRRKIGAMFGGEGATD